MAGYTRQSTASIINGSSITAPPINAEFNQLLAAFNATTGHGHTGGTGDAPKIPLTTSVSGYLPLVHGGVGGRNNVTNSVPTANDDSGDGYAPGSIWENSTTGRVYICVGNSSGSAVWRELVQVDSGNAILPASNNTVDLGNNSTRFQDLFLSGGIAAAGNVAIGGTLTTVGTSSFTGLATFANLSATGTTTITSVDLNSGAIDNAVIGSATPAAGTFTTLNANTSLVAATADINGGTIDGASLGASSPSTGSFTTLGASGTSTLATVDINGGNIDGTVIGASTTAAGSFTTLSTSGQATLATADINGGPIDGATVGASTASTGAFTTLTSSGGITGNLTGNVTGNTAGVHTGAVTGNVTGNLTGNVTAGSGTSTFTNVVVNGNLNMNAGTSATITNLTAPSSDLDAATKKYVDDEISTLIGDAGAGLDTLGELADALNDDDDFSTTVTNSIATKLPKAGGTMTGAIAMSTNKITGAGDPTSAQDVATKAYTDTQRDTRVAKTGDTMSGALAMGNNKITGLATPTAGTDVTNKIYVDNILGSSTAAATSASNAATSESNAATSATNASNSAASALTSKNAAATSLATFQNQYLGAQSSAPTQDPDGSALDVGDLYFDTVANAMKVYSSSGWTNAGSSVNGTSNRVTYTATAGQTVFAATYDSGYLDAFLNGVKLLNGTDFTATNGTSITLASGASVNDVVDIVAYGTFALADHYTRTASDARYVEVAGDTMTGDLSFGDDDKAIFGAGSDLQIYHDGSHSYFEDVGTGNLRIRASSTFNMQTRNSGNTAWVNSVLAGDGEGVRLFTNGSKKLETTPTGVNVTGTVTSDGLTVDGGSNGTIDFGDVTTAYGRLYADNTGTFVGSKTNQPLILRTNNTERMRIDTSGNLLVGTTDADNQNNSAGSSADNGFAVNNVGHFNAARHNGIVQYLNRTGNDGDIVQFRKNGSTVGSIGTVGGATYYGGTSKSLRINTTGFHPATNTGAYSDNTVSLGHSGGRFTDLYLSEGLRADTLRFSTLAGSERMRINSLGNVGIGTSSPDTKLQIKGGINSSQLILGGTDGRGLKISTTNEGGQNDGSVIFDAQDTESSAVNSNLIFKNGGSESMRITGSGNLLVGKTALDNNTVGIRMNATGDASFVADGNRPLVLNRKTSDGDIALFLKNGTAVGSIGTPFEEELYIAASGPDSAGILLTESNQVRPMRNGSTSDATQNLGSGNGRWKDLYLSGGVYLGGTGSANKLDDYEEGLWIPAAKGASSSHTATVTSATKGSYVKIGNQVTVNFILVISSIGSSSGTLQITGLPFTVAAPLTTTGIQGNGTAGYWQGFATAINNLVFTAEGNTNLMYAYATTSGTQQSISGLQINQMGSGALRGSITYRTT